MKYLVCIESLDYARQRDLETKFQTVLIKNGEDHYDEYVVFELKSKAERLENAIEALKTISEL